MPDRFVSSIDSFMMAKIGTMCLVLAWHPSCFHDIRLGLLVATAVTAVCIAVSPWVVHRMVPAVLLLCFIWMLTIVGLQQSYWMSRPWFAFPPESITAVEGTLVSDSHTSMNGNLTATVALSTCTSCFGAQGGCGGTVQVVGQRIDGIIPAATKLTIGGTLELMPDGTYLLAADSLMPLDYGGALRTVRVRILAVVSHSLWQLGPLAGELSSQLLLGRSDEPGSPLRTLSVAAGCSHVLALSGMHVHVLAGLTILVLSLFMGRLRARRWSLATTLLFVWIAGPKPSLVRAALMQVCLALPARAFTIEESLYVACSVQILLYPLHAANEAFILSYAALAGLALFSKRWSALLSLFLPVPVAVTLATSSATLSLTTACALAMFGTWHPVAILNGWLASVLAMGAMVAGLLWLAAPIAPVAALARLVSQCYLAVVTHSATWSESHPQAGTFVTYVVFVLVVLTVLALVGYAGSRIAARSTGEHDVGFSLRFRESIGGPPGD